MTTQYPTGLDSFTNPTAANRLDTAGVIHHQEHSNVNDAVTALETKVGIDGSADTTSLDYKVAHLTTPPELQFNATYGRAWFNVVSFGADPTGASDSTTAIQNAINAIRVTGTDVKGGIVFFPPGVYRCDSTIDLSWSAGTQRGAIVLQGAGTLGTAGGGSVYPTSTLKYTATGTGRFIDARHSQALTFRDLGITYSSTTFTGYLVDLENPGATGSDSQYAYFERVLFYSWQGVSNSCERLLNAGNAIFVTCISCHFGGAHVGIGGNRGGGPPDNPSGPACYYSNAVRISSCTFDSLVYAMQNPYQAWYVDGCWFEMNVQAPMNNPMVSVWQFTSDNPAPFVYASTLAGSWIGDPGGSITKNIIDFSNVNVVGCVLSGNMFAGDNTFTTCLKLPTLNAGVGNIEGLAVIGNWFTGALRGIYLPSGAGNNIFGMHVQNNDFAVVGGNELVGSYFGATSFNVIGNTGLADQAFGGTVQHLGQTVMFMKGDGTPYMTFEKDAGSAAIYLKWDQSLLEQTTVGAAGTASALPANPTKYLQVKDHNGTVLVIPCYAKS